MKKCAECGEEKPITEFYRRRERNYEPRANCKACVKARVKKWYKENREHRKAYLKQYNKENRKKKNALSRKWSKENRGKCNARDAKRRAAKLQRTPDWSEQKQIKQFYMNCPDGYHVDHIEPLQGEDVSGLHVIANLQYLPAAENISKGNKRIGDES